MFDTIFDGNEKQDHKKSMFESMRFLGCAQSTAAPMITFAGQGRNVGSQRPSRDSLAPSRSPAPSRAVCGAFFG